jgi:hypothetical protein
MQVVRHNRGTSGPWRGCSRIVPTTRIRGAADGAAWRPCRVVPRVRPDAAVLGCLTASTRSPASRRGPRGGSGGGGQADRRSRRHDRRRRSAATVVAPHRVADVGGTRRAPGWSRVVERLDSPWTGERIAIERARLLRGWAGRRVAAWHDLTGRGGAVAIRPGSRLRSCASIASETPPAPRRRHVAHPLAGSDGGWGWAIRRSSEALRPGSSVSPGGSSPGGPRRGARRDPWIRRLRGQVSRTQSRSDRTSRPSSAGRRPMR